MELESRFRDDLTLSDPLAARQVWGWVAIRRRNVSAIGIPCLHVEYKSLICTG
jgi:hypothetical protein